MNIPPIVSIGELLVDWVCPDPGLEAGKIHEFKMAAGGAPANVAIGLAKLGCPVNFLGGVSDDMFGRWLFKYLASFGVGTGGVKPIPQADTRHAYIFTDETGNRVLGNITSLHCADSLLSADLLEPGCFESASMVYFGSVIQSSEAGAKNLEDMLQRFSGDTLFVYDPNIRTCLWRNQEERLRQVLTCSAEKADILKLSDNELSFFTGQQDIEAACKDIFKRYKPALLVVTLGAEGVYYVSDSTEGRVAGFETESVEMTGAGDGFVAGLLNGIHALARKKGSPVKNLVNSLSRPELELLLAGANAVGALATTHYGATAGLPTEQELADFLTKRVPTASPLLAI